MDIVGPRLPKGYPSDSELLRDTDETIAFLNGFADYVRVAAVNHNGEIFLLEWPNEQSVIKQFRRKQLRLVALDGPAFRRAQRDLNVAIDGFLKRGPFPEFPHGEDIPYLSVVESVRPILRGYLEVAGLRTVVQPRAYPLALAFIQVLDLTDKLDRENHGFGYHYHYCNREGGRSDTVLTFDTAQGGPNACPLFWEKHAERGADFGARAAAWGDEKRKSVYDAAQPDLKRFPSNEFRTPSREALAVWTRSAILSPIPIRQHKRLKRSKR